MADYRDYTLTQLEGCKNDPAAWYWLGMAYYEQRDFANAEIWLTKTMNDSGNEWRGKARLNLALGHEALYFPGGSRDKAVELLEAAIKENPKASISTLHLGFLYSEGTESHKDQARGKELIEKAIALLIAEDGDDSYFSQLECFGIATMYRVERNKAKAIEYYQKTIARCDLRYESEQSLKKTAEEAIRQLDEA